MTHSLGAFVLRERIGFTEEVFALRGAEIVQGARAELEPQDSESIRIQINIHFSGVRPAVLPPQKALPCFHNNKDPATSTEAIKVPKDPKDGLKQINEAKTSQGCICTMVDSTFAGRKTARRSKAKLQRSPASMMVILRTMAMKASNTHQSRM